ncbi:MAG: hypothetical protein M3370_00570, partial [Actinomycetota bacterium]|nr:hypothetical protein [Actinomycetota bacterium]
CGELLPSVDRVHKISIVPRGKALGYTLNLPDEDRYLKNRGELIDYMTVLLGGRVAEHEVFGAVTTGASDDLRRVAEVAHAMVTDYAMGAAPGGAQRALIDPATLSEVARRISDEEQQALVFEAQRAAQALVSEHRAALDELATHLLEHESVERDQIDVIMAGVPRARRRPGVGLGVAAASGPEGGTAT